MPRNPATRFNPILLAALDDVPGGRRASTVMRTMALPSMCLPRRFRGLHGVARSAKPYQVTTAREEIHHDFSMNFGVHPVGHVALPVQGFAGESLSEASWSKLRAESVGPEGSGHEPRGLGFRGLGFYGSSHFGSSVWLRGSREQS